MLLTEESSRDKAASSGPENTGSRRLAGAVQQSGMEGDYAQTSQNSGGAESFLLRRLAPRPMTPGRNTRNVWDFTVLRAYLHLGSTRYPRLWTMSSRNIFTEIDEIFRRLICGYYEWERRTIPRATLATPSIGAVWTNAFLEMEGEQTCYLKTLTLVRHRGPTTRIIMMQVSSRKAKKVQNKKLQQWTTTVT